MIKFFRRLSLTLADITFSAAADGADSWHADHSNFTVKMQGTGADGDTRFFVRRAMIFYTDGMMKKQRASKTGRREFMLGAAGTVAGLAAGRAAAMADAPNVVLMIADNLGWKDLGCYGDTNVSSPNIDAMAEEGARFTNAFVTAPSCSPSRASIISGQAPHSVNVMGLTHLYPRYQMPARVPTLPRLLRDAGYRTAIHGKWHVAPYKRPGAYGYQRHLSMFSIKSSDRARRFISANKSRRFYLELNFMQTHRPSMPGADRGYRMHPDFPVDPDSIRVPDYYNIPDWPEIREDLAAYYSRAAWMDRIIGEILGHLDSEGISGNTLVVFVSDNGPMYPGGIGACYDLGIGTPLIMRWPEGLPGGGIVDGLVSTIDLTPTCLEAAGITVPSSVQGKSLLSMAGGETAQIHDAVYAEMTYHVLYTPMRMIRTGSYKYIENLNEVPVGLDMCEGFEWAHRVAALPGQRCCAPRPPEELFDLKNDPNERNNIADDTRYVEIKKELKQRLHRWRDETGDPLPTL
jgi:arylsulfatase A-like enzyme